MALGKLIPIQPHQLPPEVLKGAQGIQGPKGDRGEKGDAGPQGATGPTGSMGPSGSIGKDGKDGQMGLHGDIGPMPEHQVSNGEVRFQNPDGTWGDWIEVQSATATGGGGGKISNNTYTLVEQAEYFVKASQLDLGTNIFGVNFAGDVTIHLPQSIDPRSQIVVNDESNNAETYNITVTTEE